MECGLFLSRPGRETLEQHATIGHTTHCIGNIFLMLEGIFLSCGRLGLPSHQGGCQKDNKDNPLNGRKDGV
jgi:hypothetical protein